MLQEVDPYITGVRLTSHSTFGTNAGGGHAGGYSSAEGSQAPGLLDRVKHMVGLGASNETVCFACCASFVQHHVTLQSPTPLLQHLATWLVLLAHTMYMLTSSCHDPTRCLCATARPRHND